MAKRINTKRISSQPRALFELVLSDSFAPVGKLDVKISIKNIFTSLKLFN